MHRLDVCKAQPVPLRYADVYRKCPMEFFLGPGFPLPGFASGSIDQSGFVYRVGPGSGSHPCNDHPTSATQRSRSIHSGVAFGLNQNPENPGSSQEYCFQGSDCGTGPSIHGPNQRSASAIGYTPDWILIVLDPDSTGFWFRQANVPEENGFFLASV